MLRPYVQADYAKILAIYNDCKLHELENEKENFKLLPLQQDTKRHELIFESQIYVFDQNGIQAFAAHKGNEIRALYVLPSYRGQGLARFLLDFILNLNHGPKHLYVAKSNHLAKGLYQDMGFEVVDEFETQYNGIKVMAQRMHRA